MFLRRIEIYGFKSFAQRSVLDFEYKKDGNVTAVVGPNGSGKSNVADAIRWVTGEQSSKNLRSKKSEDVIFCGSAAKARGSYAEVSIILADEKPFTFELNNKEHTLTEIEVSRKLYRSGESEYLINHKKVRLVDVQQLLASLGFGQSSYTVIGQGMVDRLLFFTASERKLLFDEAAGVKQYEIKREQALRKLESTDSNLIRLSDILSELEPRVANLRRLVKRSAGRKELEAELAAAQQKYFGSVLAEYRQAEADFSEQKGEIISKMADYDHQIADLEVKIGAVRENPFSLKRKETENVIAKLSLERDELMREVAYLKGQIESLNHGYNSAVNKKAELESEKSDLAQNIEFLKGKVVEETTALQTFISSSEEAKKEIDSISREIGVIEDEMKQPADTNSKTVDKLEATLAELTKKRSEITDKLYSLRQEHNLAKARAQDSEKKLIETEKLLEQTSQKLVESERVEKEKLSETANLEAEIKKAKEAETKLAREIAALEKEFKELLSSVDAENLTGLDEAITSLESEIGAESFKSGFKNFVAKLNKLFEQFRFISRAMKGEEKEKLEQKLQEARAKLTRAAEHAYTLQVTLSDKHSEVAILHSLMSDLKDKIKSLSSDIASLKEVKSVSVDQKLESSLDAELRALEIEISKIEAELKKYEGAASERMNVFLRQKDELSGKLSEARSRYHQAELEYNRNKIVLDNQSAEIARAERRLADVLGSLENLIITPRGESEVENKLTEKEKQLDRLEENLAKERGGLTQLIAGEREFEQENVKIEREKRALGDSRNDLQAKLSALEIETTKVEVRLEDLLADIESMKVELNSATVYSILDQMEKDVLKLKVENLRRKLDTTVGVDPETEAEYAELETRTNEMTEQVTDLTKAKADLSKIVKELDERIKHQFADVFGEISSEFSRYFSMLFSGGTASLNLGEDEEGNFGVEISANPPGKRVKSLTALSGGERTLTSLALLFAILSVNPSPFCVLDEVDAALDESNTLRFIKILRDLAAKTQFIVISHNRDTMRVADTLYGITMNDEHVSKLLSVKLSEALVSAKQ